MPGAMRKMGVYLGLVEDDDWEDEEYGQVSDRSARRTASANPATSSIRSTECTACA